MSEAPWPFAIDPGKRPMDVVCIGHALVDRLAYVEDDAAIVGAGLEPGIMVLVDGEKAAEIEHSLHGWEQVAGGSAANTAAGVASLGGSAAFIGAVGRDEAGAWYSTDLDATGVHSVVDPEPSGLPTGVCHVLVSRGGRRSMGTHLGAASFVHPSTVDSASVGAATLLYIEGYLLDAHAAPAVDHAIRVARESGTLVALSLSDPFVVSRHFSRISDMVSSGAVDVLFGNEEEALGLTGAATLAEAEKLLARPGKVAIITRGPRGSVAVLPEATVDVPANEVDPVVDTTGAGDLFAAGCLFAIATGSDPEHALALGSFAAGEIISHMGARPEVNLREAAPTGLVSSGGRPLPEA